MSQVNISSCRCIEQVVNQVVKLNKDISDETASSTMQTDDSFGEKEMNGKYLITQSINPIHALFNATFFLNKNKTPQSKILEIPGFQIFPLFDSWL